MKAVGKAIKPIIKAIQDAYEKMISDFERNKNSTVNFVGIGCAACKVGYYPLNKGLIEQNLTTDIKDSGQCVTFDNNKATFDGSKATFNEKSFAVGIHPSNGQVMLTDPGKTIQRPLKLPEEMPILIAMHNYYEENKKNFSNPIAVKQIENFSK